MRVQLKALDRLQDDHQHVLAMADRIMETLAGSVVKGDLEQLVFEVLDFADTHLRPHLAREQATLMSVIREHLADTHADEIEEAQYRAQQMREDLLFLREAVELRHNLRGILEATEMALREYVEYEETHLIPWALRTLDVPILQELERRFQALERKESSAQFAGTFSPQLFGA